VQNGGFLEYSNHFENYYGTPRAFVEEKLKTHDVILEIEVDGALQVKKAYPESLLVMILPPDRQTLISRLKGRGSETDESIARRISRYDYELSKKGSYDYVVINDGLDEAVEEIENIIEKEKGEKYD
jgi:guanylate kinase